MVASARRCVRGTKGYYTQSESKEERYYTGAESGDGGSSNPVGEFLGEGAKRLNLDPAIYRNDPRFSLLYDGKHPETGELLRRGAGTDRIYKTKDGKEKVVSDLPAIDMTFSAPKSVSVLWALAANRLRQQLEEMHQRSIYAVANYLETNMAYTRTGRGGKVREKGDALFAAFRHETSRANDPNLHTHLIMFNLIARADGKWGALDARGILNREFLFQMGALCCIFTTSAGYSHQLRHPNLIKLRQGNCINFGRCEFIKTIVREIA